MKGCEICPLVKNQKVTDVEVLLQTRKWNVVLDKNQDYLGKAFVTLREHKAALSDPKWPLRREKTPKIIDDELFRKIADEIRGAL